jgi:hypothetical protein
MLLLLDHLSLFSPRLVIFLITLLVLSFLSSYLLSPRRVLSHIGQFVLARVYTIWDVNRKTIRGPLWQWPNGQIVDKFLLAKQCSFQWQRYGPVYRIWAFATPEM